MCLYIPLYLLYLLQPLDIGYFSPLKKAYLRQVKKLMRNQINYITKTKFLPTFINVFNILINRKQIKGGF
jgi:DDE superfamily endonuclease